MTMLEKILRFRRRLKDGPPVLGPVLDFDCWQGLRILREVPQLDFVWIDLEHSSLTHDTAYRAIDTLAPLDVLPLVRATTTDLAMLKRTVDLGPAGVIFPLVNSLAQARELLDGCLYAPEGNRGMGANLAANQWLMSSADYMKASNENLLIIAQVEHVAALKEIDAVCALPRIDLIFIGRYDLSASLGVPREVEHPRVVETEKRICEAARRAGKPVGTIATSPGLLARTIDAGYDFILLTSLMKFMTIGVKQFLAEGGVEDTPT